MGRGFLLIEVLIGLMILMSITFILTQWYVLTSDTLLHIDLQSQAVLRLGNKLESLRASVCKECWDTDVSVSTERDPLISSYEYQIVTTEYLVKGQKRELSLWSGSTKRALVY